MNMVLRLESSRTASYRRYTLGTNMALMRSCRPIRSSHFLNYTARIHLVSTWWYRSIPPSALRSWVSIAGTFCGICCSLYSQFGSYFFCACENSWDWMCSECETRRTCVHGADESFFRSYPLPPTVPPFARSLYHRDDKCIRAATSYSKSVVRLFFFASISGRFSPDKRRREIASSNIKLTKYFRRFQSNDCSVIRMSRRRVQFYCCQI